MTNGWKRNLCNNSLVNSAPARMQTKLWGMCLFAGVSLIVCLFKAPALTYSPFVQSSPNVQVSWPSSLLQHLIAKLGNKCLNTHLSKCLVLCCFCSTRSPNWQKISLSWNYFLCSFIVIPTQFSSSSWRACSSIRNHHYCGFYQRDSLIVGVVSTLQALSFDSHPFKP